jgi:hypothetical protein
VIKDTPLNSDAPGSEQAFWAVARYQCNSSEYELHRKLKLSGVEHGSGQTETGIWLKWDNKYPTGSAAGSGGK